jgi:hypothetical protein
MRRHVLALLSGCAAMPALAQDRPPVFPTRDVAVTYRITSDRPQQGPQQGMQTLVMSWQAATRMLRTDLPGMGWMVADQNSGRAFMVMEQMRMIMDIPLGQAMQQGAFSANATFRREGSDTVAGLSCTVWSYQDAGNQGRACVTTDGVMLRAQGTYQGNAGGMEATGVAFGPQDAARFQRPTGYQTMQMPQGGPVRPPAR